MHSSDDITSKPHSHDPSGGLQLYMREIGQTPLLTIAEEVVLADRIRRGDQAARDHMICANLRLVVKIAMDYKECGLPLLDLISEGNIGLVKAVERFDPRKGGKLSTYAGWWIRQSVKRALATQGKTIRLPVHLVDKIAASRRAALALTERLGREPSDEELAVELQIPTAKVALWRSVSARPASLDAQIGDDEGAWTFGEIIRDEHAPSPYECLREKTSTRDLHAMIAALEPREARIIRLRFGLDGDEGLTLEQVAQQFGITRERIRQLEALALKKLRRAMARQEKVRTRAEVELEERQRRRMAVIKEFIENHASEVSSRPPYVAGAHRRRRARSAGDTATPSVLMNRAA